MADTNDWAGYRRQVLQELINLHVGQKELKKEVVDLRIEMAITKTKLALVSVAASALTTGLTVTILELVLK